MHAVSSFAFLKFEADLDFGERLVRRWNDNFTNFTLLGKTSIKPSGICKEEKLTLS